MEPGTLSPNPMSLARIALHYTTLPFSHAQDRVSKVTRSLNLQIPKPVAKTKIESKSQDIMPSSFDTSSFNSDFHLFSSLPPELRIKIWQQSLPGSRVIELQEGKPRHAKLINRQLIVPWVSRAPVPALLHVCRESREEGLRYYHLAFGKSGVHPPRIYVSFEDDIIYFSTRTLTSRTTPSPLLTPSDFASSPSFSQIQRLALIPRGVLELVEWDCKIIRSLKEVWVVNQMTQGRSFRLGRTPKLVVVKAYREDPAENQSTARAIAASFRAQDRLLERAENGDFGGIRSGDGNERDGCLMRNGAMFPIVRTSEFVKTDGDEYLEPERRMAYSRIPGSVIV